MPLIKKKVSKTGTVVLDLIDARRIVTNATVNLAGSGGIVASDSAPALARVNGATDPAMRLAGPYVHVFDGLTPARALGSTGARAVPLFPFNLLLRMLHCVIT